MHLQRFWYHVGESESSGRNDEKRDYSDSPSWCKLSFAFDDSISTFSDRHGRFVLEDRSRFLAREWRMAKAYLRERHAMKSSICHSYSDSLDRTKLFAYLWCCLHVCVWVLTTVLSLFIAATRHLKNVQRQDLERKIMCKSWIKLRSVLLCR
jgi:hypothetical protein